ncbi:MAG: hypothetical protein MK180_17970 [Rhodobacteraceae bacterium]|nr:hypothetical protein [Paracoccaceae bacterium]
MGKEPDFGWKYFAGTAALFVFGFFNVWLMTKLLNPGVHPGQPEGPWGQTFLLQAHTWVGCIIPIFWAHLRLWRQMRLKFRIFFRGRAD